YRDGHWVETEFGHTWVSDYAWGDIPYHYGTWVLDPFLGWAWVPGYTWAPAWVVFRTGPGIVGWAPVPPAYQVGAAIGPDCPEATFVFVPQGAFLEPRIRTVILPPARSRPAFAKSK